MSDDYQRSAIRAFRRPRLDHDETERLRPVDRKQQGRGVAEKSVLLPVVHLAGRLTGD
jgi:hypothetical protein